MFIYYLFVTKKFYLIIYLFVDYLLFIIYLYLFIIYDLFVSKFLFICLFTCVENWTAAEELSLADQTRKMGLGAWDEISDSVRQTRACGWFLGLPAAAAALALLDINLQSARCAHTHVHTGFPEQLFHTGFLVLTNETGLDHSLRAF